MMSNVNGKTSVKNYQPTCLVCNPETCDYIECDKRRRFMDEESARLRAELKSFMEVKA